MTMDPATSSTPRVVLVDPSLFTEPYDAGLGEGLDAVGVPHLWAIRPVRQGQRGLLPADRTAALFYRHVDDSRWIPRKLRGLAKAASHVVGLGRLILLARRRSVRTIHFQWTVLPLVDAVAIALLRRFHAIVVTVHDTTPFNGDAFNFLQRAGFFGPARMADAVIVHTETARDRLLAQGLAMERVFVVPHGPLPLRLSHDERLPPPAVRDQRRTFTLFGQMKPYKGIDVLIEAVGLLPRDRLLELRIVIAGAAMMDLAPLHQRIAVLGLEDAIAWRIGRLSEPELASLFEESDVFLFPYRQIDASGAYYTVRPLGKWIVASRVGVFAEDFVEGRDGRTVPAEDPASLSAAIVEALDAPPDASRREGGGASWAQIAQRTDEVYRIAERRLTSATSSAHGPR